MIKGCIYKGRGNNCRELLVEKCRGNCSFRKTREENEKSIEFVYKRLSKMDNLMQTYISDKYYKGEMPWTKEE